MKTPAEPRIPKRGDLVSADGHTGTFAVIAVNKSPNTVDLQFLKSSHMEVGIPWTALTYLDELDESQNALRVVREATEDR